MLKVNQLKILCRELGLETSGQKENILERLYQHFGLAKSETSAINLVAQSVDFQEEAENPKLDELMEIPTLSQQTVDQVKKRVSLAQTTFSLWQSSVPQSLQSSPS